MGGGKKIFVMPDRVTIDTSVPFRSVKEAVALFGERIITSQVIANQLSKVTAPFFFFFLLRNMTANDYELYLV